MPIKRAIRHLYRVVGVHSREWLRRRFQRARRGAKERCLCISCDAFAELGAPDPCQVCPVCTREPAELIPIVTEYPCGPAKQPLQIHPSFQKMSASVGRADGHDKSRESRRVSPP
jgi:hypothetical protein